MADEKRVVLVKPGDVLLIGGMGRISHEQAAQFMARFKELTRVTAVALFPGDVTLDSIPAAKLRELLEPGDGA